MNSLSRRLTLALVSALLGGGLIAAVGLYLRAIDGLNEQFNRQLFAIARNVSPEELPLLKPAAFVEGDDDAIVLQLWAADNHLLYHSDEALAPLPRQFGRAEVLETRGDRWYSYSRQVSDGRVVQVAQAASERSKLAAESALQLLMPLLLTLPFMALLAAWMVARELQPLRLLAVQLTQRNADDDTPVSMRKLPGELAPIVEALNQLFTRQAAAAAQQRAFLAEAAHELRTPIAVVQLQAHRAREAVGDAPRREAFTVLQTGIARLTHLVTQLLALARSEGQGGDAHRHKPLQFDSKLREWLAALYPFAQERNLDFGLTYADPCRVLGDASGLQSLVVNLVQNAIAYTTEGGQVNVALQAADKRAVLTITDTGPGIALAEREHMFERFVRGSDVLAAGSGLGLAIVREQAARHGGTVELLDSPTGQGLMVSVTLPLAD